MKITVVWIVSTIVCLTGCIGSSSAQQADFFWSVHDLNQGAENAPIDQEYDRGDSGSLFLYYTTNGPRDTELAIGFFVDIQSSVPGVIRFTNAETFDFPFTIAGIHISNRLTNLEGEGGVAGKTGSLSDDLVKGLAGFSVVGGPGILECCTGIGVWVDHGYDVVADAFQVARLDFEVVGEPGQATNIRLEMGTGLIANNPVQVLRPTINCATVRVRDETPGKPFDCNVEPPPSGDLNGDGFATLLDVAILVDLIVAGGYNYQADINEDNTVDLLDVDAFVGLVQAEPDTVSASGDLNCDGRVNLLDIAGLIAALVGQQADQCAKADLNGDGVVDLSDAEPFIDQLLEFN